MAYPDADIYLADHDRKMVLTEYRETEHYKLTRDFINNPEQMLCYLFEEAEEIKLDELI
jgi:predicted ATPase